MSLRTLAKSLVERARLGDQNAMALIAATRANAKRGVMASKLALHELAHAAQVGASSLDASLGEDEAELVEPHGSLVLMALGAGSIDPHRLSSMLGSIPEEYQPQAAQLVAQPRGTVTIPIEAIARAACALGHALRLQRFQRGEPLSIYCPAMGWEVGE